MRDCTALDIGGTFVKYGCFQEEQLTRHGQFSIREDGRACEILDPIVTFLRANPAEAIAISMPGPMDYEKGISRMTHKFAGIRGMELVRLFQRELPGCQVSFVHDAVAFLLGEMAGGAAMGCADAVGITLGTGLGFVRAQEGKILVNPALSPAEPLWNAPYRDGAAEDYVSGRAIRQRWLEMTGESMEVKAIAECARTGVAQAMKLWQETGEMLGEMLNTKLEENRPEKIVAGGQIAKSWDLMREGFCGVCTIPIFPARYIDEAALRGAFAYAKKGKDFLRVVAGNGVSPAEKKISLREGIGE